MGGRLTFPRKENRSCIRATRVTLGQNVKGSIEHKRLLQVAGLPRLLFLLPLRPPLLFPLPMVNPNKIGARNIYGNEVAATRASVRNSCVSGGQ